jgi:predicted AlkP superfamily phosphohydrolase/phosphomutase
MKALRGFLILFTFMLAGCTSPDFKKPVKVSLIGLDGATWEIIDPLIAKGELPAFARLKREGAWGYLETYQPTESVSIWTSIATGVEPTRHEIQTFTRTLPGSDKTIPIPGSDRMVPALWNMLSDAGRKVVCVKWFATWPAEVVNGAMLSPRLEDDAGSNQTYPPELYREISGFRHKSTIDLLPKPPKKRPVNEVRDFSAPGILIGVDQVEKKMFDDTSVWEAGQYVYHKYEPDLYMIYLKSIDRVEHFLWGAQNVLNTPDASESEKANAETIFGWYRYFDSKLQELMTEKDRVLIVVSDHGMHALDETRNPYDTRYIDINLLLSDLGYQIRHSPKKTVWNKTIAYVYRSLPYDWACEINLNVKGREPSGFVEPESFDEQLTRLKKQLSDLSTSSGDLLFARVESGAPNSDIYVEFNRNITLDHQLIYHSDMIPLSRWIDAKGLPRGIHTKAPDGIIAAIGPGITSGVQLNNPSVFDITPTVLYAMDLAVAKDFKGACLMDMFKPSFRSSQTIRFIDTYGQREVKSVLKETEADNRIKDELRALGYI